MVTMPPYVIEPPDILMINAIKVVPKPPHILEPFDGILIRALGVLPDQPIADAYFIDPEGKVDLGPSYGQVQVANMTTDEAQSAIQTHLGQLFEEPVVTVSLAYSAGAQQIQGEHLVAMDGRVNLGTYGSVYVAGKTLEEARSAIEEQLSEFLEKPQVVVDVFAYNSKKYYVVTQGAGIRRQRYGGADHRERNRAGRHLANRRYFPDFLDQDLDCSAGSERRGLRADIARQLGRYHQRSVDGDQLSVDASRPAVHRTGSVHHVRQLVGQIHASV